MYVYIVLSVTSGYNTTDYTPYTTVEGVFEKLEDARNCFNKTVNEYEPNDTDDAEENIQSDYCYIVNNTEDYSVEIRIIAKELIKGE